MTPDTADLAARLAAVRRRIAEAATAADRAPGEVRLLLATKTQDARAVRAAIGAGATLIGENRVQELVTKGPELTDLSPTVHLIGHLQSNKVNAALPWVTCVQSIDTLAIAGRLSRRVTALDTELEVMVQVNVSGEDSKHGVDPVDAAGLATAVAALPGLRLTGFMTIGAPADRGAAVRDGFRRLREVRDAVTGSGEPGTQGAHELSMGMSGDLESAVAEGSTMVRVGSAVFGARPR
ncbi:YggS family pyridoxal phosphate-dependent enzyme [Actinotalea sp. K2]|uniref:YggS family pyridoxal phosphate-dependent enzyme n=1 Tax=Actinotalea sp. K2 TaxID=2939438 RepID=UPI00201831BF|nr:YggS family pyridoxal phosphate-dependent enzyme [Actinotalea sp. K2]MCL3860509.1 YggS family pyridoxal phosphate-dependent enzyme [Actinotalea sp. K2]